MTHLEALLDFSHARRRDTWAVYGSVIHPATQTEFAKDSIFQLQAVGTIWNNALFYCKDELHLDSPLDWINYVFNDPAKGTIKNELSIIHPSLHCILTEAQLTAIVDPVDLTFVAFKNIDPVEIDDDELNIILLDVGVPFITLDELEYSREEILKYMIKPALDEFYKWYPIVTVEQFPVPVANINVPIPPYVNSVLRAYINPGYPMTGAHQNPITRYFDEVVLSASSRGSFASPSINYNRRQGFSDLQGYSTFLLEKAVRQGAINHGSRKRIRVELKNGRVIGYSNIQGILEVEWGSASYDWADIPFNRLNEVREFAGAKVLRALGALREQSNDSLPGTLNYDNFRTKAEEIEKRIVELWQNSTKAVVVR